jgi:predicted Zn-ribbon and HTH transcriptional regulator
MNKRQIIASLNNIANTLDYSGMIKEANTLTKVMKRLAKNYDDDSIDEELCPKCEADDIETDKNGNPTKCYHCGWPEEEDEDRDNEEPR